MELIDIKNDLASKAKNKPTNWKVIHTFDDGNYILYRSDIAKNYVIFHNDEKITKVINLQWDETAKAREMSIFDMDEINRLMKEEELGGQADPKNCMYTLEENNGEYWCGKIILQVYTNPPNDDVRTIDIPEFDEIWENDMENTWSSDYFSDIQEAHNWCIKYNMILKT